MSTGLQFKIILISLISFSAVSQHLAPITNDYQQLKTYGMRIQSDKDENVNGTPYINDAFMYSRIQSLDTLIEVDSRHNIYKDEIEFKSKGEVFKLTNTDGLVILEPLKNRTLKYLQYSTEEGQQKGFLIAKTENAKVNFYVKEIIKLIPKKEASNPYDTDKPAHYKREGDVFFIGINGAIKEISSKKKEILALFPDHKSEIQDFIKDQKISLKDEADLVTLVNYINTILK